MQSHRALHNFECKTPGAHLCQYTHTHTCLRTLPCLLQHSRHAPPLTAQSHNARLIGTVCVFQSSADPGLRRMITQLWRYDLGSTYEIDRCEKKNALIVPPPLPLSPPLYRHCHYHYHHYCHHHHHSRRNCFSRTRASGVSVRVCINLAGCPLSHFCVFSRKLSYCFCTLLSLHAIT